MKRRSSRTKRILKSRGTFRKQRPTLRRWKQCRHERCGRFARWIRLDRRRTRRYCVLANGRKPKWSVDGPTLKWANQFTKPRWDDGRTTRNIVNRILKS